MSLAKNLTTGDPEKLLGRIAEEFPQLSWHTYKFLNHSWDHEVIILDGKLVFRFPNSDDYLEVLRDEIELLAFLSDRIPSRIPSYTFIAKNGSFAGYKIIPGIELTEAKFGGLPEVDRQVLAHQLAAFLTALHTTPLDELRGFNVKNDDLSKGLSELQGVSTQYLQDVLSKGEYEQVQSILADCEQILHVPYKPVLTHSDIAPKHIIWDGAAKKLGTIDFSDRCISDPALDFAELFSYGRPFVEMVYKEYEGPKDEQFLARAATYMRRVGVHMLTDSFTTDKVSFKAAKKFFDTYSRTFWG